MTAVGKEKQIHKLLACSMELHKRGIPAVTIESLSFHITWTHKLNNLNSLTAFYKNRDLLVTRCGFCYLTL